MWIKSEILLSSKSIQTSLHLKKILENSGKMGQIGPFELENNIPIVSIIFIFLTTVDQFQPNIAVCKHFWWKLPKTSITYKAIQINKYFGSSSAQWAKWRWSNVRPWRWINVDIGLDLLVG